MLLLLLLLPMSSITNAVTAAVIFVVIAVLVAVLMMIDYFVGCLTFDAHQPLAQHGEFDTDPSHEAEEPSSTYLSLLDGEA